jgi:drug/metabolite transporter (DMT)-like permease
VPSAPSRRALLLAFAGVYVAWGSTYLAIRVAVESIPPTVLAGSRFAIAGGGMLVALRLAGRSIAIDRRTARVLAIVAAFLLLGGNGLVVWAEQSVPSGLAALLVATLPLWMAGLAALPPAREPLSPAIVFGLLLGFAGVGLLAAPSMETGHPLGVAALLCASLSWACGSIYARRAAIHTDPLVATGWEMLFGGAMFLVLAVTRGAFHDLAPQTAGLLALAHLIVAGSWIGFTAYVFLLAHVPASTVATYAYVNPVIAVLLGWWLLGEPITPAIAAGSAIIIVAVAIVTTARAASPSTRGAEVGPAAAVEELS